MRHTFKVGDTVILRRRQHRYKMIVATISSTDIIHCVWLDKYEKYHRENFSDTELIKIVDEIHLSGEQG